MYPSHSADSAFDLSTADDIKQGLAGRFWWPPFQVTGSRTLALDPDTTWTLSNGYVSGCGNLDFVTTPDDWNVFALTTGRPTRRVAESLRGAEKWDRRQWSRESKTRLVESFFWGLFPGAAVVAVHPSTGTICLIRDALGFCPLYYSTTDDGIRFSTSLAHLRRTMDYVQADDHSLAELLVFGQQFGSRTAWKSIDALAPGQCVVFLGDSRASRHTYVTPSAIFDQELRNELSRQSPRALISQSRKLMESSLSAQVQGRNYVVQGGGGVDSSVLVALSAKQKPDVEVWSINHADLVPCEEDWMGPLWKRFSVTARYAHVTRQGYLETLVELLCRSCQPLIGPNFVGGAILRKAAVHAHSEDIWFVNGESCDTLFGGLSSFHQLAWTRRLSLGMRMLPRRLRSWVERGLPGEHEWFTSRFLGLPPAEQAHFAYGSLERSELIEEVLAIDDSDQSARQNFADRLTWLDFRKLPSGCHHGFFERDEWYGGHLILPFVDRDVFRFAMNLPCEYKYRGGHTKWLWRSMAAELIGKETAFRAKRGFDAPIQRWLQPAVPLLRDGFLSELFRVSRNDYLEQLASRHALLWPLINIELWGRIHCYGESPESVLEQLVGTDHS